MESKPDYSGVVDGIKFFDNFVIPTYLILITNKNIRIRIYNNLVNLKLYLYNKYKKS